MTNAEIKDIFRSDATHREMWKRLGRDGQRIVLEMMQVLPAEEFREVNPLAEFDVADIPIPLSKLIHNKTNDVTFTEDVKGEMSSLLEDINTPGKNIEYPYAFIGLEGDEVDYCVYKKMAVGDTQTCTYDWKWIENFISNPDNAGMRLAIFHTHPKSFGTPHKTLFNKYPEILQQMGVQPDGLNISLADVYVMQYLDMLIEKHGANITPEALILLHNGELVSFSTTGGFEYGGSQEIERFKNKQNA